MALVEDTMKYLLDTSKKKLHVLIPMYNSALVPAINRGIFINIYNNRQSRSKEDGALTEVCIRARSSTYGGNSGGGGGGGSALSILERRKNGIVFVSIDTSAKTLIALTETG